MPFKVDDFFGASKFTSPNAFILAPPNPVFAKGIEMREWRFACPDVKEHIIGGSVIV